MRKVEIAQRIAEEVGITNVKAEEVVNTILEEIKETLSQDDRVIIRRFGTFELRAKRPRMGRNPKTGEDAPIPARRVIRFKSGKIFKAATNSTTLDEESAVNSEQKTAKTKKAPGKRKTSAKRTKAK